MSSTTGNKTLKWDGFDCIGVEQMVGHYNWAHKDGVLIVKNKDDVALIPKGEVLELDASGNAISKLPAHQAPAAIISSVKRYFNIDLTTNEQGKL